MADREDSAPESALAYSVLENDADADNSYEHGPRRLNSSGARGGSGRLSRGLRASCPHVVLVTIYLAFILIGGGFFYLLERKAGGVDQAIEKVEKSEYELLKGMLVDAVFKLNLTERGGQEGREDQDKTDWAQLWEEYTTLVEGLGPYFLGRAHGQWELSFTRSVLFCATTITTIGYGDAVPNSAGGKVLVVVFSLVGIPLTLIVLADIGMLLARGLAFLVDEWRHRRSGPKGPAESGAAEPRVPVVLVLAILTAHVLLGSGLVALTEGWYYADALYFTFITLTTIGFGDIVPVSHVDHVPSFLLMLLYVILGLSGVSMCVVLLLPRAIALISKVAKKIGF